MSWDGRLMTLISQRRTNSELHHEALALAEAAERRASRRKEKIRESATYELAARWQANRAFYDGRNFDHEITEITNKSASSDPLWKGYVSDNQWHMARATMYGIAAGNDLLSRILDVLTSQRQTNG